VVQRPPTIACEDVPLDEARTMGHGPRMDPELYHAFKEKFNPWTTEQRASCFRRGQAPPR
jgi:hypothetical protein